MSRVLDSRVRVSRVTLDRWIRAWRTGGFDALVPATRHAEPHTPALVLELAAALKREVPARTAAQVAVILGEHGGWAPSAHTLQRHFARLELNTRPDGSPPKAFGRFEAAAPNDRWTGDALHGPVVAGRKTYLFAFIDDHSRALTGYRWGHSEDTVRLEAALHHGISARGIPRVVYLDNGSAMISKQLMRALAVLGIQLTHSKPREPPVAERLSGYCAPRGALSHPRHSRGELEGRCLGLMAYLEPKGEGDKSMPGNQWPGPGVGGGVLGDPRDTAKAGLLEAQSPEDESSHPPERRPIPAPALRRRGRPTVATFGARSDAQ